MRLHMNAADVRHLVTRYFLDLGADAMEVADVQENIRIDRGRCVARCYRLEEMFAKQHHTKHSRETAYLPNNLSSLQGSHL